MSNFFLNKRFLIVAAIILWLSVVFAQSVGLFKFGEGPTSKSWAVYMFFILLGVVFLDFYTKFKSKKFIMLYIALGIYFLIFGFSNIYDWGIRNEIVNRVEHFVGAYILAWILFIFLEKLSWFNQLNGLRLQLLMLFSFATIFGVINEIIELLLQLITQEDIIGKNPFDTSWDLLMNFFGFVTFLTVVVINKTKIIKRLKFSW